MPLFVMQDVKRMLNYAAIAALGEEANTRAPRPALRNA